MNHFDLIVIVCVITTFGISKAQEDPVFVDVLPGEMPYHVSVQFHNTFWGYYQNSASGIILDETHVLTITPYWPLEDISILSGVTNIQFGSGGQRHEIKNVFQHPNYSMCYDPELPNPSSPAVNNLYIIEVEEPFEFSTGMRKPAKLPPADFALPASGVVASWESGGLFDDALKKITIPILNNSHCEDFFGKYRITENMFCGAYLNEAGESYNVIDLLDMGAVIYCKEDPDDSESPDVACGFMEMPFILNELCKEPTAPTELDDGNQQFKKDCKSAHGKTVLPNYPTVFTSISKYLDWINDILNQKHK